MNLKAIICTLLTPGIFGYPLTPTSKLSLATWGSYHQLEHKGPGTYAFGYDIEDPVTGNVQFKQEERHPNGTVTGQYGYVDANGKPNVVTYVSDEKGYRAKVQIEGEETRYYPPVNDYNSNYLQTRAFENQQNYFSNEKSSQILGNDLNRDRVYPGNILRLPSPNLYLKYTGINQIL